MVLAERLACQAESGSGIGDRHDGITDRQALKSVIGMVESLIGMGRKQQLLEIARLTASEP